MSAHSTEHGVLPLVGAVPYLTDDPEEARRLLATPRPTQTQRWFHAAPRVALESVVNYGLIPGCWHGGDTCVVFGERSLSDIRRYRRDVVVEVASPAHPSQLAAWWVPPVRIAGAWLHGSFVSAAALRTAPLPPKPTCEGCSCGLDPLVREQQELWRRSVREAASEGWQRA
jgi:hypothetical protein